ncbi:MAG: N-6 DNA methylase [Candidatus Sericytochromatia bacterium]|nr:N-6 DNA methylase [Candidatus Sericytochromatia bacterium]
MLQQHSGLKNKINELWDKFWSGGISNPLTAIEQITYLLFMKRLDELDLKRINDAEFTKEAYTSKFEGVFKLPGSRPEDAGIDKQALRWSHFKRLEAEVMLTHVQTWVFPFLKELNGGESPFTHHMKNAVFIIPKPSLLVEAVKIIDEIFTEMENDALHGGQAFQDIQGDVYEYLLSEIATAGKNGQFRTPRHIIKLMADLVQPQLGQKVADPACGTGGFLLGAYQYMVSQLDKKRERLEPDEDGFVRSSVSGLLTEEIRSILSQSLHGYDIDVTMVRLGLMNLMMHGLEEPQIHYQDTLSKGFHQEDFYDVVMANPPFTGSIDKSDINENLSLNTTKTELLFVERIFRLLRQGGTAAIVVPQGVLFGSNKAFVAARQMIIEEAELKAVITLPSGVFKPYAGVSTAILIFTRGGETEQVWFYEMQSDGYSLDDKRSKLDGYGDLQDIVTRYHQRNPETDTDLSQRCFYVPKAKIKEEGYDLSFSRYKEEIYEEIVYDDPQVILKRLIALEVGEGAEVMATGGILKRLLELEEMLG